MGKVRAAGTGRVCSDESLGLGGRGGGLFRPPRLVMSARAWFGVAMPCKYTAHVNRAVLGHSRTSVICGFDHVLWRRAHHISTSLTSCAYATWRPIPPPVPDLAITEDMSAQCVAMPWLPATRLSFPKRARALPYLAEGSRPNADAVPVVDQPWHPMQQMSLIEIPKQGCGIARMISINCPKTNEYCRISRRTNPNPSYRSQTILAATNLSHRYAPFSRVGRRTTRCPSAPNLHEDRDLNCRSFERLINTAHDTINQIISSDTIKSATFESILLLLADCRNAIASKGHVLSFYKDVSSDAALRRASREAKAAIDHLVTEIGTRQDLYALVNAVAENKPELDPESQQLLDFERRNFFPNGLGLAVGPERDRFAVIKTRLGELKIELQRNMSDENGYVAFSREELAGMPEEFLDRLEPRREPAEKQHSSASRSR